MRVIAQVFELHGLAGSLLSLFVAMAGTSTAHASTLNIEPIIRAEQDSPPVNVTRLESDTDWRDLAGNERHHYRLELTAGQYLNLRIETQGTLIRHAINDPNGRGIFVKDKSAREFGIESVSVVTQSDGPHTLTVGAHFADAPSGRYRVTIDERRAATQQDRERCAAQAGLIEAERLLYVETQEAHDEALKLLSKSLLFWEGIGDREWQARALHLKGFIHYWRNGFEEALDHLNRALVLRRAEADAFGQAETMTVIGSVYIDKKENRKALEMLDQALALQQIQGERRHLADIYYELGKLHHNTSDNDRAAVNYEQALKLYRQIGDKISVATTLASLSMMRIIQGEFQLALDALRDALDLYPTGVVSHARAATLHHLGSVYYNLGEPQKAFGFYEEALVNFRELKDISGEAHVRLSMGIVYNSLGEQQNALTHLRESLKLREKAEDKEAETGALRYIGKVYRELGELSLALDNLKRALEMAERHSDYNNQAGVLVTIGEIYTEMGEYQRAHDSLSLSLSLRRKVADRRGEAASLYSLAVVERDRRRLKHARAHLEAAIEIIESLRSRVSGVELRTSYLAAQQRYYEFYIDLLMRLHEESRAAGHDAEALQASERARARALLETLAEAKVDIRLGVDAGLLERERRLGRELNAKEERRFKLRSAADSREDDIKVADREVEQILDQLKLTQAQIRTTSPRYAALVQPQPLDLNSIQAHLDEKSLLLVYSMGTERSFLFAVTRTTLRSYVLPKRELLEREADEVYRRVKDNAVEMSAVSGKLTITDRAGLKQRQLLSQKLLGPVARQMIGRRLIIVADGRLQYLPFSALTAPGGNEPLILNYEIVNLPSLSVLDQLRRDTATRPTASLSVAVIADPVYSLRDERFKSRASGPVSTEALAPASPDPLASIMRATREFGMEDLPKRLYASRQEADRIASLFEPNTYTKITGFEASRSTLAETDLSRYRILHFATHGFLNSQNPELSGVVLSLYDERGRAQDGFLRAHEIYNLKLGADLVVLSACQSALGKDVRGEGLISMARGFMYAGAPRVVVSLWKVDDRATAELMDRFYQEMTLRHLSPAAALRAAQATMARHEKWSSPYNWAGFVLQGEWR